MKHSFKNDYSELAHPQILEALSAVGGMQFEGYGLDEHSERAAELIREKIALSSADVHFISGGTHANLTVLSSALKPHEAVIAPKSGHISTHEAGAIEATGHKICAVDCIGGKLHFSDIEAVVEEHCDEHMVKPRLVYISQATETGMVYTKTELSEISNACHKNDLYLFVDGARLSTAINSHGSDLAYADIANVADIFYIGGTKNGALYGEAIVICNDALKTDFRYHLKQKGALLSKGAAIGVQFEALLKGELLDILAQHANAMSLKMADGIVKAGYKLLYPAQTNMIFPTFPPDVVNKLREQYEFYDWLKKKDKTTVRLVTSWATPESVVDEFIMCLQALS